MANLTKISVDQFYKKAESKTAIKRVIKVSGVSEIDTDNLGCHWTANKDYTHTGGGQNGFSKGGVLVEIYTSKPKEYNKIATSFSREGYPHEKEVVLCENSKISVVMRVADGANISYYKSSASSGNRVDGWARSL